MEKIIEKLEKMIEGYLDNLESRPVRTLILSIFVYYVFKGIKRRG